MILKFGRNELKRKGDDEVVNQQGVGRGGVATMMVFLGRIPTKLFRAFRVKRMVVTPLVS
jgi:hypothetical protein